MTSTAERTLLVAVPVLALLAWSVVRWTRRASASASAQLLGAVFAAVVVLTHVAEAFRLWPSMGWGQPGTAGHYTDLGSAVLAIALLCAAALLARRSKKT